MAAHVLLEDAEADYMGIPIDLKSGWQNSKEYLNINPKGRVPALITEGKILTETPSILAYVAQMFPEKELAPKEPFEFARGDKFLEELKEKGQKMGIILVRATPIMEVLTGFMIAGLIYCSARMVHSGTLEINNFFSFLAAMMLSYQPVRALATLNIGVSHCLSGARRVFEIIDQKRKINENINAKDLVINKAKIEYKDVSFAYDGGKEILKSINHDQIFKNWINPTNVLGLIIGALIMYITGLLIAV